MPTPEPIAPADELAISVVVPSYLRSADLARCLDALGHQTHAPREVIVVARPEDSDTRRVCAAAALSGLRVVDVRRPGMVAALNAGIVAARGEIIAITDDDAQPEPAWLREIHGNFASDLRIGAVGGPDVMEGIAGASAPAGAVGRIARYGRLSGNHHAGVVREDVHFLKGVNMAYRASALRGFDEHLRGSGAQVGNDLQASLSVSSRGYRVIYDPRVRVRHYPAARQAGDERARFSFALLRDQHHNEAYILATTLPARRAWRCGLYMLLVGYRSAPGVGHLGLRLLTGPRRRTAPLEFIAAMLGRVEGFATARRVGTARRTGGRP